MVVPARPRAVKDNYNRAPPQATRQPFSGNAHYSPHDVHGISSDMDCGNDTPSLLRPSEDQARSSHIDALFDAPRAVDIRFRLQLRQQRDCGSASASGGRIFDRGIGMPRERRFGPRGENPYLCRMIRLARREYEGRFGIVELVAIACICGFVRPCASRTTASGLPSKHRCANTSRVT